jgi:hypothetical protein
MPIDSLSIRGVRGIREEIRLQLKGNSLLVRGDNGTGKSSIERALRWALIGEEEPTSESPFTTESSYRKHVLVPPDFPQVGVTFTDGSGITVQHGGVKFDGDGSLYRDACRTGMPFLRRSELLDVLVSRPVDRFQYFESFLGLQYVDGALEGLADMRATLERRATGLRTTLEQEFGALLPLLPHGMRPPTNSVRDFEQIAIELAEKHSLAKNGDEWEDAKETVVQAATLGAQGALEEKRGALLTLRADFLSFKSGPLGEPPPALEAIEKRRKALERQTVEADLEQLIKHAVAHFRVHSRERCPICRQLVDWETTLTNLESRDQELAEYRAVLQEFERTAEGWSSLWSRFKELVSRLSSLLDYHDDPYSWLGDPPRGLDLLQSLEDSSREARWGKLQVVDTGALNTYVQEAVQRAVERIDDALAAIPTSESLPEIRLLAALFEKLSAKRTELRLLEKEEQRVAPHLKYVTFVYEAIRKARQDVAREILTQIRETVSAYYFAIHPREQPDEATGAPSIDVQRHASGTAFVRGEFSGQSVKDPQWVYSDGHLDTVGICIFLALRRFKGQQPDDPKLLVLDDIILSIDLGHARRLIELLKTEFSDHQLLILTHNGLFAYWCANLMPGLRKFEIKGWTLEGGPRIGEYADAKEKLISTIDQGSPKEIGLCLMALMDEWLFEARFVYAVAVPAKYGEQYTLTEIWEPFAKTLKKLGQSLGTDLGGALPIVEHLKDLPAIRNTLAAHENEFAREFPRETIAEVAGAAVKLIDALYCTNCRSFAVPIPNRFSPSIVHCRCQEKQYLKKAG